MIGLSAQDSNILHDPLEVSGVDLAVVIYVVHLGVAGQFLDLEIAQHRFIRGGLLRARTIRTDSGITRYVLIQPRHYC